MNDNQPNGAQEPGEDVKAALTRFERATRWIEEYPHTTLTRDEQKRALGVIGAGLAWVDAREASTYDGGSWDTETRAEEAFQEALTYWEEAPNGE